MARNLYELFAENQGRCAGRTALHTVKRDGADEMTYAEMHDRVLRIAGALAAAGINKGDRVVLLSENRAEWYICLYAIMRAGGVAVPLYTTASAEQQDYIIRDCGARFGFVSKEALYDTIRRPAEEFFAGTVIFDPETQRPELTPLDRFMAQGDPAFDPAQERPAAWEDTAILIYTSGTTGEPKGVMLSHRNIISDVLMLQPVLAYITDLRYLSILPLSHAYEFAVIQTVVSMGGTIIPVPVMAKTVEYIEKGGPTIACAVPRLFEKIYNTVLRNVGNAHPAVRMLFYRGLRLGEKIYRHLEKNEPVPFPANLLYRFYRRIVFDKIRNKTVRTIQLFISGGAAIQPEIVRFFNIIGTPIVEGYGISECSPVVSVNMPDDRDVGTVGPALTGLDVRIAPDGEVIVRGPIVMSGYWNKPDETRAVMDDHGFFHTGDIAVWTDNKKLKIIGRMKDIIVMASGKNVAPAKIENMLAADPWIDQACVVGDEQKYLAALIVPDFDQLKVWAKDNGIAAADERELIHHPAYKKLIKESVDKVNRQIESHEALKRFHIHERRFTVEGGELTPTLKLKRREITKKYKDIFDSLYS
ncbi:MAG TPA: long-chain fatty acid--CoA ligase [bacterium]|nr:long-chain fatty acid--CoA ligase [bacterium]